MTGKKPPKPTGPDRKVRALVVDRAGGCCERCGRRLQVDGHWIAAYSIHHRRPRAMGGSRRAGTNSPANLLLLCGTGTSGCHGWVEAHRVTALANGFLLNQGDDPGAWPVRLHQGIRWLTDDGGLSTHPPTPGGTS